jgi:hypothetical protein
VAVRLQSSHTAGGAAGREALTAVVRPSDPRFFPVARVGPPTPTRARRLFDASVDPTEARKLSSFCPRGRSGGGTCGSWPPAFGGVGGG